MELYNAKTMPLSNNPERRVVQEKIMNNEPLTLKEKILYAGGHDRPYRRLGTYECKPDHCYRGISKETYEIYKQKGYVEGFNEYLGEVIEPDGAKRIDNGGVDWYLGGAAKRYGEIIIECPADKEYFVPNYDNGFGLSSDLEVRHMKSSGKVNPVPMSMITNVFDLNLINNQELDSFEEARKNEIKRCIVENQAEVKDTSLGGKSL